MIDQPLGNKFEIEIAGEKQEIDIYSEAGFAILSNLWTRSGWQRKISYEVTWLGVPIIQLPEDMVMLQELIYKLRPDLIIETGTAHGGTAIFYASILELLGKGQVISIDIEIRKYNRLAIQSHPLSKRISLLENSSIEDNTIEQIRQQIQSHDTVLVALDSNHSYAHVQAEMEKYAPFVSLGSYLVVFDGVMEHLTDAPDGSPKWSKDSASLAIRDFLADHSEFKVDPYYNRLAITYCPQGFLKRII